MIEKLKLEILVRGQSDYTGFWELPRVLGRIAPNLDPDQVKYCVIGSVRSLATQGLIEIGGLERIATGEPLVEFVKWPVSVEQAIERIEAEWESLGREPHMGEIAWLLNTPSGNFAAQGLRDED
jgi:hypothetical protein